LSLGLTKPSSIPGVYFLYSWKKTDYYCGLEELKPHFQKALGTQGLFIKLSEFQYERIVNIHRKKDSVSKLSKITEFFQTAVHMDYDKSLNMLTVKDFNGLNNRIEVLRIQMDKPSPFTIVKETLKEFHGFYSSASQCDEALKRAFVNTNSLWISAYPLFNKEEFSGLVAGFSNQSEYGLDVLKHLKRYSMDAAA